MDIWTEILGMAVSNGLWAVLFVCLLFHQIRDSRKRETRYQSTIDMLGEKLKAVKRIQSSVDELGEDMSEVKALIVKALAPALKSKSKKPREGDSVKPAAPESASSNDSAKAVAETAVA